MKTFKRTMLRAFFVFEIIVFVGVYFFGPRGAQAMNMLELENQKLNKEINLLKDNVFKCENDIELWKSDDFYKEKIAREHLQMARKSDEIFYLKYKE